MRRRMFIIGMLLVILAGTILIAQTSRDTINLQGRLTDSSGSSVADGSYTFKIRLYDSATGGTLLYSEEQTVTVSNGIYNIVLGTGTIPVAGDVPTYTTLKDTFANTDDVWLGMSVNSDSEMTPRSRITSTGYAMKAISAEKINGLAEAELLGLEFKSGVELSYVDANTISVSGGSIVINGIYRRNQGALTVSWTNLDTGVEQNARDYFVYAVADNPSETTFTVVISLNNPDWHPSGYYSEGSGLAPVGVTNYRLLGYFHNSPTGEIIPNSVTTNENLNGRTLAAGVPLPGMVKVGSFAVDIYEASIFSGSIQYGVSSDDYPAGFADTGNQADGYYAVSRGDITPSTYMTWFQAAQAAANSGKRLVTNLEWQIAAAGTPDDETNANINTTQKDPATSWANCVSRWNCYEMVGNVWEWVGDWIQAGRGWMTSDGQSVEWDGTGTDYGDDYTWNLDGRAFTSYNGIGWTNGLPVAIIRGGCRGLGLYAGVFALRADYAASDWGPYIGFRCAR